ncbi:hypothetical protein TNCV_3969241 [Trichonephila clavipes]|nr:hypothetical protein TNCV_3969241 [Trichonephila clavipes]
MFQNYEVHHHSPYTICRLGSVVGLWLAFYTYGCRFDPDPSRWIFMMQKIDSVDVRLHSSFESSVKIPNHRQIEVGTIDKYSACVEVGTIDKYSACVEPEQFQDITCEEVSIRTISTILPAKR